MAVAPAVMLAATAISAGTAVASGVQGAMTARAQAEAARRGAEFSRELGERNARAALGDAEAEEARYRRDADRAIQTAIARIGARGGTVSGTPLAQLSEAVADAEEQALLIRHGGFVASQQSLLTGGTQYTNQMTQAGTFRANIGQSLLSGWGQAAGQAASGYASYNQMTA